ncbi:hypothetical protein HMPREF1321_1264 [Capnocytophaga sp. oral taxon 412 str. F0487]|uniref:hypothetical protein n=1 Tax=Capnocytophaga sp. oral taxon 412 TaxID=712218 RepID=UPI0002696729|nr:hypothetical protein [Capnocytophaga sp. oral taxon 412]EIW92891.1 hypothetical protein HMPREF1321_1264 [Capnocytophaga sp. oral taxon 412 str. F0487]
MRKRTFKFGMLALVALALTYCQREDTPEAPQQDPVPTVDPQAVVSLNEAKSLFEASENQKRTANSVSRSKRPLIELETDWRYFEQTQTLVGDAYSKIPVTIVGSDLSAEMLFLKKDGVIEQNLFITKIDSLTSDNRIVNADFYLFTPKGEFISAYRMKEGVITHELVPKYKGRYRLVVNAEAAQAGKSNDGDHILKMECDCDTEYFDDDCECIEKGGGGGPKPIPLDEVTVYGKRKKRIDNSHTPYPSYTPYTPNNNNGFPNPDSRGSYHPYKGIEGSHKGGSSSVGAGLMRSDGTKVEEKVDDDLTNPCAKAVLEQAKTLNSEISNILGMFGSDDNYNIRIHNKSFATDPEHKGDVAYTKSNGSIDNYNNHTLNCDIYLNDDIISSASQEYILATIYHEVIHAYLNAESQILGQEAFNKKYPFVKQQYLSIGGEPVRRYVFLDRHERFAPFIESLARSIMSLPGTNISYETAIAMAKAGVVEDISLSEREKYLDQQQKLGKSGIPCKP